VELYLCQKILYVLGFDFCICWFQLSPIVLKWTMSTFLHFSDEAGFAVDFFYA